MGNVRLSYTENLDIDIPETVFYDNATNTQGWDSNGPSDGGSAEVATDKSYSGGKSFKIHRTTGTSHYAHSNERVAIDNDQETAYTFSGRIFVESEGYAWGKIILFMDDETGSEIITETASGDKIKTKGEWVYFEKTVMVPANIDKINLRIGLYHQTNNATAWFDDLKIVKGNLSRTTIVEESNYYPFGLKHKGYNNVVSSNGNSTAEKFKFQGQEYEDELGKNTYAYQWRDYDPAIGRFNKIDRFAEKYMPISPYSHTANNPIRFVDVKGDSIFIKYNKKNILYDNGKLYSKNKNGKYTKYTGKGVKVNKDGSVTLKGFLGKAVNALDKIRTGGSEGGALIGDLQNSKYHIKIKQGKNGARGYNVSWDPSNTKGGVNGAGSSSRPSFIGLAHELGHAHDALDGKIDTNPWFTVLGKVVPKAEQYGSHWENRIRGEHGLSLRSHYYNSGSVQKGSLLGLRSSNFNYSNKLSPPTIINNIQVFSSGNIKVVMLPNSSSTIIKHQ